MHKLGSQPPRHSSESSLYRTRPSAGPTHCILKYSRHLAILHILGFSHFVCVLFFMKLSSVIPAGGRGFKKLDPVDDAVFGADGDSGSSSTVQAKHDSVDRFALGSCIVIKQKHVVVFLCFLALFIAYIVRICLSQAMLPMSVHYGWDESTQGHIFAAFYYGYVVTQVPGGWASQVFGSKYVIFGGILGSSLLNALAPVLSQDARQFIILRMATGFVQGVFYPSCLHLLSCWVEPKSRSLAVAFVISGQHLGTAVAQGVYPWLASRYGWRSPFYIIGMVGVLWSVLWLKLVKSKPTRPSLSLSLSSSLRSSFVFGEEKPEAGLPSQLQAQSFPNPHSCIEIKSDGDSFFTPTASSTDCMVVLKDDHSGRNSVGDDPTKLPSPPWHHVFGYSSVWAYFVVFFCYNWSFYLLVSYLPKYLTFVMGMSAQQSGKVAVWAYVGLYISILVGGRASNALSSRFPLTAARKVGVAAGLLPPVVFIFLIMMTMSTRDINTTCLLFILAIASTGLAQSCFAPNPMDLAPRSPAFIASVGNMLGTVPGFLSSIVAGSILQEGNCNVAAKNIEESSSMAVDPSCLHAWKIVFGMCCAMYFIGLVVWVSYASALPLQQQKNRRHRLQNGSVVN